MNGIRFGTVHSGNDLALILLTKKIGVPKTKKSTIEIPGSDGTLDYTEYFGAVNYDNRDLEFAFEYMGTDLSTHFSDVQNKLHGKKMNIVLDEDPGFYYVGRVEVNNWAVNKSTGRITITCECEPYKYKANKTISTFNVSTSKIVSFANLRKPAVPKFTTTAQFTIKFGTQTHTVGAGVFEIPTIQFNEGANSLTFQGNGSVTVEYQEGGL